MTSPLTDPSNAEVLKRAQQLALGCGVLNNEVHKTIAELHRIGVTFPDSLPTELHHLELDLEHINLILRGLDK